MVNELASFYGPNAGYVLELYERYQRDPASVDPETRAVFEGWSAEGAEAPAAPPTIFVAAPSEPPAFTIQHVIGATALAHGIRARGHLGAHLDPLGTPPLGDPALLLETYGLTEANLAALPPDVVGGHAAEGARNALEAINRVRAMYSGTISYEFDQVKSPDERGWLRDAVGLALYRQELDPAAKRELLERLAEVEAFERYLHQTFPGQKRFSIEGVDALVPMLDEIIGQAMDTGTREVAMGMAHRGRLNVLAHILEKPYMAILSEFMHPRYEERTPASEMADGGWTGDVKYHLGAERLHRESAAGIQLLLASNPSHLEFVNPVVEGMARAAQEDRDQPGFPTQHVDRALPILIHGDAAFPGEGIVAETLNLWRLPGYYTGGTIHIITNNQLGFTTEAEEGRSTHFASDLAKGFEVPIVHVNADDPEACLTAARLAYGWRSRFHKDILVELVGYRRWGHNEGDEPAFTQPQMYEVIRAHPTVRALYAQKLEQEGTIDHEAAEEMMKAALARMDKAKHEAEQGHIEATTVGAAETNGRYGGFKMLPPVSAEQVTRWTEELLKRPEGFTPNAKLERLLQRYRHALEEGGIDWGQAEALAFASILAEGIPIRLTGQDTERGTFSHRHAVLHDEQTGKTYIPLQHLSTDRASFAIYNSPLSEAGVLGFEYGYSIHAPEGALVLWEAQFGDFANSGQVMIDQFIASARAKWRQEPSLTLLLPHGYEGQGPEHSSARLERYLQLAAEDNLRVANCSTSAQYYHLLRLHAAYLSYDPRPLIIMTPKSLLRHPHSASRLEELTEGEFQPVIDDELARDHVESVTRVVACAGKVSIDLLTSQERAEAEEVAIVRVESLYPFPEEELAQVLAGYPRLRELVWTQEEPENMGAWTFVAPKLQALVNRGVKVSVISRPERASPAEGLMELHQAEQQRIITQALKAPVRQRGGRHVS
ncbi:MAG TPA: 2-oxoglutarate dehydrogenase E1 component [Ktedonobacterales bacterium]|jgi:2-oxoglutarate dehydrogenase E1 component